MFFSVLHNTSGEEHIRRLSPTENKSITQLAKEWLAKEYSGELTLNKFDGHIPCGCGEYTAEVRRTKKASGSCWESLDFFAKHNGE